MSRRSTQGPVLPCYLGSHAPAHLSAPRVTPKAFDLARNIIQLRASRRRQNLPPSSPDELEWRAQLAHELQLPLKLISSIFERADDEGRDTL